MKSSIVFLQEHFRASQPVGIALPGVNRRGKPRGIVLVGVVELVFLQEHFSDSSFRHAGPEAFRQEVSHKSVPAGTLDWFCTQIHLCAQQFVVDLNDVADYAAL
jgi:hypothetical protein